MSTTSKIEWTEQTWNPVTGCTKISPGWRVCRILCKRTIHRRRKPACP